MLHPLYYSNQGEIFDPTRGFVNQPYAVFLKSFGNYIEHSFKMPFIDAVKFEGNIDIKFTGSVIDAKNLSALRSELRKYDLDLIKMDWPADVLILEEKGK